MKVTIRDIAKELGLNPSTVAYALSGKGSIKEATRQKVRKTADQMGYIPGNLAKRMTAARTGVIGLVIPDLVVTYNEIAHHMFRMAASRDYRIECAVTEFNGTREWGGMRAMLESRVDGVVVRSLYPTWDKVKDDHPIRQAINRNVPVLRYGDNMEGCGLPTCCMDQRLQAKMATEHLLSLGRQHIAWLLPLEKPFNQNHLNYLEGCREAMAEAGIPEEQLQVYCLNDIDATLEPVAERYRYNNYIDQHAAIAGGHFGRRLLLAALEKQCKPDAILSFSESCTIAAMQAAMEKGMKIPDDLAFACLARTSLSGLAPCSLTTIAIAPRDVASTLLDGIFELIEQPTLRKNFPLIPELIVGQSSQRSEA